MIRVKKGNLIFWVVLCLVTILFSSGVFPENYGQNILIFRFFNTNNNKYCTIVEIRNIETNKKYKSNWTLCKKGFSVINNVPAGFYCISKAYYIAGGYSNGFEFPVNAIKVEVGGNGIHYYGEYFVSEKELRHVDEQTEKSNKVQLETWFNVEDKS